MLPEFLMRSISMSMRSVPQNNLPLKHHNGQIEHAECFGFVDDAIVFGAHRSAHGARNPWPNRRLT
jgi:hypothetical protein